jgi:phosphate transport system permease protein
MVCAVTEIEGERVLVSVTGEEREDFLTGERALAFGDPERLPLPARSTDAGAPAFLAVSGSGSDIYVAWRDGWLARIRAPSTGASFVAEEGWLTAPGVTLTEMAFVLGQTTLVWGDSRGGVRGGFLVSAPLREGAEGLREARRDAQSSADDLAVTKEFAAEGSPLTAIGPSSRRRLVACGFADGRQSLYNVTSGTRIATVHEPSSGPVLRLSVSPKEDGLLAFTAAGAWYTRFDARYPDFASLFLPVWYEGYPGPQSTWQSSSGHTGFEPKLGLVPLIFGTFKATLYSMLFGAPLALLAAVYTSSYLSRCRSPSSPPPTSGRRFPADGRCASADGG